MDKNKIDISLPFIKNNYLYWQERDGAIRMDLLKPEHSFYTGKNCLYDFWELMYMWEEKTKYETVERVLVLEVYEDLESANGALLALDLPQQYENHSPG